MTQGPGEPTAPRVEIVTLSFHGDLDVCRTLCASIDGFASDEFLHSLYVPASDVPLFADLATERRRVATQESLLPRWFWKAPLPSPQWRKRLFLPRRNVYLTPFSPPVRGWIAQQIMKIAATLASAHDVVAFLDSDNALIRRLTVDRLAKDGLWSFYRHLDHPDLPGSGRYYESARRLLGLPNDNYRPNYIHPMIVWRRAVVEGMIRRIEQTTGQNWIKALARTPHFAEYVIYGLYVERVIDLAAAESFAEFRPLVHSSWVNPLKSDGEAQAFVDALTPDHVGCNIQSTSGMSSERRSQVREMLIRRAAQQDAATTA
jgi:Family of unknown function (DUF6492)